jgi:molybdate transport system substrate-binding protein
MSVLLALAFMSLLAADVSAATRELVIAASPSLADAVMAVAGAFEQRHPDVKVRIYFDDGLDMRRTIAAMENNPEGKYFIGKGPIHLVAPGGDELIARLQMKYYVLPGTARPYMEERLVLIVPESLTEAPTDFEALRTGRYRVAVADPGQTQTGKMTAGLLRAMGLGDALRDKLDTALDSHGVLDHLLSGQADVGIALARDAVKQRQRVRIVAHAPATGYEPVQHSMAMERYCPDRDLCSEFLGFLHSVDSQRALTRLGYSIPLSTPTATQ